MTAEERARTLTGRHQISNDGRRLVDGIPFGRPYLRNSSRPAVRIPPRKRQRTDDGDMEPEVAALLPVAAEGSSREAALLTNGALCAGPDSPATTTRASKRVHFDLAQPDAEEDEDSDEDDDDFVPGGEQDDDAPMDDDTSADDSDSTSDSDSNSPGASGGSSDDSDSDSDSSSSDSDSDSDSDDSAPPEVRSSKGVLATTKMRRPSSPKHVVPGEGLPTTRSRNARRTRTNRLRYLKAAGKLPPNADLKALEAYEAGLPAETTEESESSRSPGTNAGKRKRNDDDDVVEDTTLAMEELEQRKKELMARLGESESSTVESTEVLPQEPTSAKEPKSAQDTTERPAVTEKETPKKRLRPDTSAISRILARQAMPARRKPSKTKAVADESPEPEGASDPDFWKSKINLSAFECWEEDFELSAPPYPFKQHWDPVSKKMREKAAAKKKKGGRNKRESIPVEVEEEEEEEEKIFLDYDDTGATEDPDAPTSTQAAIEDQLRQDVATAAQADLPALPEDMSTLPDLNTGDMKVGAIIVCKFFSVNPKTITPEISDYKTAIVDREGDSGPGAGTIRLKIAQRDLPKREKKFDSKGNRIYDAADQFYMEDEDEEEDLWEGQYSELLEPKLLQAAA
jgi:hypothetical protein